MTSLLLCAATPAGAVAKSTPTTAASASAKPTDRIAADLSKLAPAAIARRALLRMRGDHTVSASFELGEDPEPHVIKGHIDPETGDARFTYRHVSADDPTSETPGEVRIRDNVGYGALDAELRAELQIDWYRFEFDDTNVSVPDRFVIGRLVAASPSGAVAVETWKQKIVATFGPKTRHFTGSALAKDAVPMLNIESDTEKVNYEIWVDSSGELRRLQWTLPAKAGRSVVRLQADFRSEHKALAVTVPVAKVADLAELLDPTRTT